MIANATGPRHEVGVAVGLTRVLDKRNEFRAMGIAMAEFDRFAGAYDGGMSHPLKRLLGASHEQYLAVKARWLLRYIKQRVAGAGRSAPRMLDYGCGTGLLLECLHRMGWRGELHGCDVSQAMIRQAVQPGVAELRHLKRGTLPYAVGQFDLVVICCVLHHTGPEEAAEMVRQARRVLGPGGHLVVFEHNPRNPLTRLVVRQTPIDQGARLVGPPRVRALMRAAGFRRIATRYLMFLPPRWPRLAGVERLLAYCPLGGQYAVAGTAGQPRGRNHKIHEIR